MKKNQLIIGGSILCVVLLFFMLIYRSSGGKSYVGDSQISIRIETGINLPKVYLDSLLTLVDLYQNDGVEFTQSAVSVFSSAVDSQSIQCPISGMNQFRSKFSGGFYTFTARQEDMRTTQLNPAQFVSVFSKTCPLPDQNANLLVHCDRDSSGMFKAVWSVTTIKSMVAQLFKSSRYVKIYFTTGTGKVNIQTPQGDTPGGYGGNEGGGNGVNGGDDVGGNGGGDGAGSCTSESVNAQINLETGLPNVFSWNEQEGFTYDFSLSCLQNCDNALSVYESNVIGGNVEVRASWAQTAEIEYLATLTVKCNGKVVKVIKSTVQIRCA